MHEHETVILSVLTKDLAPTRKSARCFGLPQHDKHRGFTLIELLVTIGIILLLIGLLVPTVSKMMKNAKAASTQSLISQLQGAIEQYHQTFHAYPGPLTNGEIYQKKATGAGPTIVGVLVAERPMISMSENLVLGLLGGLKFDLVAAPLPPHIVFDPTLVGGGSRSLNQNQPKVNQPFLAVGDLSGGHFVDDASAGTGGADDSSIPEFVDRFSNPMPILYLRARTGGADVVSYDRFETGGGPAVAPNLGTPPPTEFETQYDLRQIISYTGSFTGTWPTHAEDGAKQPLTGVSIGMGKDVDEVFVDGAAKSKSSIPRLYHGLRQVTKAAVTKPLTALTYQYPFDAYPYFQNASGGTTPKQKDGYILISAGKDRVYGTEDDITNFGSAAP